MTTPDVSVVDHWRSGADETSVRIKARYRGFSFLRVFEVDDAELDTRVPWGKLQAAWGSMVGWMGRVDMAHPR